MVWAGPAIARKRAARNQRCGSRSEGRRWLKALSPHPWRSALVPAMPDFKFEFELEISCRMRALGARPQSDAGKSPGQRLRAAMTHARLFSSNRRRRGVGAAATSLLRLATLSFTFEFTHD